MTERLRTLMREETDHLAVPVPPVGDILTDGRRIRRRRRLVAGGASVALVAGLAGGVWALNGGHDDEAPVASETRAAAYGPVVFGGSTVAIGSSIAAVPGTVHDAVYTGAGVLVRSNQNGGISDGSGPETLTYLSPDGETVDLGVVPEGVGPATDPDQDVYALAEKSGDGFVAVLRDVTTGQEVARVDLPDGPKSYWDVPPLALDGDTLYVGYLDMTRTVDWRTGKSAEIRGSSGDVPEISAGRVVTAVAGTLTVRDAATGETLLQHEIEDGVVTTDLSFDGRSVLVASDSTGAEVEGQLLINGEPVERTGSEDTGAGSYGGVQLIDVATGETVDLPTIQPEGYVPWSFAPDGRAMSVTGDGILLCDMSGCETESLPDGLEGDLNPAGHRLES